MPLWFYIWLFVMYVPAGIWVWWERWRENAEDRRVTDWPDRAGSSDELIDATALGLSQDDLMTKGVELNIDGHRWATQAVNMTADCNGPMRMELQMIQLD